MVSQGFTFPPPPPPPPVANTQAYPIYVPPGQHFSHGYGQSSHGTGRGGRGRERGRGRGEVFGGSRGSGNRGVLGYNGYPSVNTGYSTGQNDYHGAQPSANPYSTSVGYANSNNISLQQSQYPANDHTRYTQSPKQTVGIHPQHPIPPQFSPQGSHIDPAHGRQAQYGFNNGGSLNGAPSHPPGYRKQEADSMLQSQPIMMGPPIRMGFGDRHLKNSDSVGHESQGEPTRIGPIELPKNQILQLPLDQRQFPNNQSHLHPVPRYENISPRFDAHGGFHQIHRGSPNPFPGNRGRAPKRMHGEAFDSSRNMATRVTAPPSIPSFVDPMLGKPSSNREEVKKPRKKKRRHNQLGLTPRTEEHESSEEEDVDEEIRLAATQPGASDSAVNELTFLYNGQVETLKSLTEIAAWIAERKKRYPTKAKADEAAERRAKEREAIIIAKEQRKDEVRKKQEAVQKKRDETRKKNEQFDKHQVLDSAVKAKQKAEKLRKRYEKAQLRVAKLEAQISTAKDSISELQQASVGLGMSHRGTHLDDADEELTIDQQPPLVATLETPSPVSQGLNLGITGILDHKNPSASQEELDKPTTDADPLTPLSQPLSPNVKTEIIPTTSSPGPADPSLNHVVRDSGSALSAPAADEMLDDPHTFVSDTLSDLTSSSSDLSEDGEYSDETSSSSSSSAPTVVPSVRSAPHRVPPPKSTKPKAICKVFLNRGRCPRGGKCNYRHELPEKGSRQAAARKRDKEREVRAGVKPERISLYQRLVAQEKAKEAEEEQKRRMELVEQQALIDGNGAEVGKPATA